MKTVTPKAQADGVSVYCSHDAIVKIDELKPNPKNPNTHPENQIEILAKVIEQQGWRQPIKVSKRSGYIVSGHGRYQAALFLGVSSAPVDFQDYETEEQELADLLADNRIAELAEIDNKMLSELFSELSETDIDISISGYTDSEIQGIFNSLDIDDTDVPNEDDEEVLTAEFNYKEQYAVIVMCADEAEQEETYNRLHGMGFSCKVVAT